MTHLWNNGHLPWEWKAEMVQGHSGYRRRWQRQPSPPESTRTPQLGRLVLPGVDCQEACPGTRLVRSPQNSSVAHPLPHHPLSSYHEWRLNPCSNSEQISSSSGPCSGSAQSALSRQTQRQALSKPGASVVVSFPQPGLSSANVRCNK